MKRMTRIILAGLFAIAFTAQAARAQEIYVPTYPAPVVRCPMTLHYFISWLREKPQRQLGFTLIAMPEKDAPMSPLQHWAAYLEKGAFRLNAAGRLTTALGNHAREYFSDRRYGLTSEPFDPSATESVGLTIEPSSPPRGVMTLFDWGGVEVPFHLDATDCFGNVLSGVFDTTPRVKFLIGFHPKDEPK